MARTLSIRRDRVAKEGGKTAMEGPRPPRLRYRDRGRVHLDFYRTLNGTLRYLRERYGQDFLDETFRRMAQEVYRSLRDALRGGDPEPLVEHWRWYLDREGADYRIERTAGNIRLRLQRCPGVAYLRRRGIPPDPAFCRQTIVLNEALAEGTPFRIATRCLGEGQCEQVIARAQP